MDYSSRQRYRARRRAVEHRRRIAIVVTAAAVLVVGFLVSFAWPRRSAAPAVAPGPTAVAPAAVAPAPGQAARPTAAALAEPAELVAPGAPAAVEPALAPFFDDRRFSYEPGFYAPEIQAFLDSQPGPLKGMAFQIGARRHSYAEVVTGQTIYSSINPKVVLALLETQSGLLSTESPSADQIGWAVGYRGENGNRRGLTAQVRWALRQMTSARREYREYPPLTFDDGSSVPARPGMQMSEYAVARVLAPTTTPSQLPVLLQRFQDTYTRLFGDPRQAPTDWPGPSAPFLVRPMERVARVTSFFDHDAPFLGRNGSTFTYWGRGETDIYYDGHDGWDYALAPPDMALAAAAGQVVFAGNADDNCETQAVVIDHGNGYRTLYWHLSRVDVDFGQQVAAAEPVGMIGSSGCSSGPHLHLGVQHNGRGTDPYGWCGGGTPDPWQQNPAGTQSVWLWADRPSPCEAPPAGAVAVDTDGPGFTSSGGWQPVPVGYGGGALFAPSLRGIDSGQVWELRPLTEPAVAVYQPELPGAGRYRVIAYVPYAINGLDDATRVRYRIRHSDGESEVWVDEQEYANDWIDLGTYTFTPEEGPMVSLSNLAETGQRGVWADVVMWLPAE